jgi:hypothetical protein
MASKSDMKKAEYWRKTIRDAARSGVSIRKFFRRRKRFSLLAGAAMEPAPTEARAAEVRA